MILHTSVGFSRSEAHRRNLEFNSLLVSTPKAFLRVDLERNENGMVPGDLAGPLMAAVAVHQINTESYKPEGTRIIAAGSAVSFTPLPGMGLIKANIDFIINSFQWLSGQEESVHVRSKSLFRLPLKMNTLQAFIYAGIVVILIPLLIL